MNDRLYQMLRCNENAEIQDRAFKHTSLQRNRKQNAIQT